MVSGRIMQYAVVWLCVSTVAANILPSKEEQLARVYFETRKSLFSQSEKLLAKSVNKKAYPTSG